MDIVENKPLNWKKICNLPNFMLPLKPNDPIGGCKPLGSNVQRDMLQPQHFDLHVYTTGQEEYHWKDLRSSHMRLQTSWQYKFATS